MLDEIPQNDQKQEEIKPLSHEQLLSIEGLERK